MLFFLRGVAEVGEDAATLARRLLLMREDHRRVVTETFGRTAANGHVVLEHLYERPITWVGAVEELAGVSYPAANQLVARLVDGGILREVTGRARNRIFAYQSYIDLFNDDAPRSGDSW